MKFFHPGLPGARSLIRGPKTIGLGFLALLGLFQPVESKASTLCFVSALPRAEKIDLLYQGKKVRPFPFGEGDITACLTVPPGNLGFTIDDPLLGSKALAIRIDPGQHKTAVIHEKMVLDPKTRKEEKTIAFFEVPAVGAAPAGRTRFRIAYVGGTGDLKLTVNGSTIFLADNSVSEIQEGGLSLSVQAIPMMTKPWSYSFEKAGSFVVVVFPGHDGQLKCALAFEAEVAQKKQEP